MVIAQSFAIIQVQMRIRDQRLNRIAISGVVQNGTTLILQVTFSIFNKGSSGLILGYLLGRVTAVYTLRGKKLDLPRNKLNKQQIHTLATLILPTKSLFLASILDAITLSLPALYIGKFFTSSDVGVIGLLQSIMLVPISLAGIVISSSLFSNAESIRALGFNGSQKWFNENLGSPYRHFLTIFAVTSIALLPVLFQNFVVGAGCLSYGDSRKVDREISRVLKPGGSLILVDALNHNPIYVFNRIRHLLSRHRSMSTVVRIPRLKRINGLATQFEEHDVQFFGNYLWLYQVSKMICGHKIANVIYNFFEKYTRSNKLAFKFVFLGKNFKLPA